MAKTSKTGRGSDRPWTCGPNGLVQQPEDEQVYDFGNSAILLTHPAINGGETVQGVFSGNWVTVLSGRTSFAVTSVHAQLVLPSMELQLPGRKTQVRTQPGSIHLSKSTFEVPKHLVDFFPQPNNGTFGGNRFYQAVFGLHVVFPYARGGGEHLDLQPTSALLRTVGYVQRDGSLIASGIGTIIGGFLNGLMFACGHPSGTPAPPPKCNAVEPNATWKCDLAPGHTGQHMNAYSGHVW